MPRPKTPDIVVRPPWKHVRDAMRRVRRVSDAAGWDEAESWLDRLWSRAAESFRNAEAIFAAVCAPLPSSVGRGPPLIAFKKLVLGVGFAGGPRDWRLAAFVGAGLTVGR